ncbi:MAG: ComEC/Rec2 family competence protein [Lentisphaeria bacterium]|nr:ComEC/Rec2 family competence protein [Lentisphaeria bacterium]
MKPSLGAARLTSMTAQVWTAFRSGCPLCDTCPAVPLFALAAVGIVSAEFACRTGTLTLPAVICLLGGGMVAAGMRPWRPRRLAVLPLAVAWTVLHHEAPWDRLGRHAPERCCRMWVRGTVCDLRTVSEETDVLPPPQAVVLAVRSFRLPGEARWHPTRSSVLVRTSPETVPAYGERVMAEGVLVRDHPSPVSRGFDYAFYLRTRGIRHLFEPRGLQRESAATGWRRAVACLLRARGALAAGLTRGIHDEDNAGLLLAMLFGFRSGVDARTHSQFLRSGAIHLFAVSGLHVGIMAVVLGKTLQWLGMSQRRRCAALPVLLGLYVLMTGASPSAARAWLMLSIGLVSRACFRAVSPINVVAVAGLVLLLANPLALFQTGFLFSFTLVAVLVLGWPMAANLAAAACERELWLPRARKHPWRSALVRKTVQAATAGLLAWFGSAGIMLHTNGMLIPAALPVNILLSTLAGFILSLAVPKALLSCLCLPGTAFLLDGFLGGMLNALLHLVRLLVDWGSRNGASLTLAPPGLPSVLAYYAFLALALAPPRQRALRLAGGCGAVVWILAMALRPDPEPVVAVFHGGGPQPPVLLLEDMGGLPPVQVFCGSRGTTRDLMAWMQERGHRGTRLLVIPWRDSHAAGAVAPTLALIETDTVLFGDPGPPPGIASRTQNTPNSAGQRVRCLGDSNRTGSPWTRVRVTGNADGRTVTVHLGNSAEQADITLHVTAGGRATVTVRNTNGECASVDTLPSLRRHCTILPLRSSNASNPRMPARPRAFHAPWSASVPRASLR